MGEPGRRRRSMLDGAKLTVAGSTISGQPGDRRHRRRDLEHRHRRRDRRDLREPHPGQFLRRCRRRLRRRARLGLDDGHQQLLPRQRRGQLRRRDRGGRRARSSSSTRPWPAIPPRDGGGADFGGEHGHRQREHDRRQLGQRGRRRDQPTCRHRARRRRQHHPGQRRGTLANGGGICMRSPHGDVSIISCLFLGNVRNGFGGALACGLGGFLEIADSRFTGNAAYNGGAMDLDRRLIRHRRQHHRRQPGVERGRRPCSSTWSSNNAHDRRHGRRQREPPGPPAGSSSPPARGR